MEAALAILAAAVSAQVAAKVLILGALFGAAFAAYRCLPTGGFVPRAVASTVYLMNPFVYGRLQYGHLFLLAGYALLPWTASCLRQIVQRPSRRGAIIAAAATALLGMLEVQLLIPLAVLSVVAVITGLVSNRQNWRYVRDLFASLALALLLVATASSYWLIPLLLGSGLEARTIAATGQADVNAYSAVGDPRLGLLPNLLGLYGFWAEANGRFTRSAARCSRDRDGCCSPPAFKLPLRGRPSVGHRPAHCLSRRFGIRDRSKRQPCRADDSLA
ncbi:MAG: hypothetical protein E6I85_00730 [Chloroflexi bacterium]|nr:MAG: hypothetical protein E6I85_00730 [Chloroflexota bacterium]